jgi:hypothetical protein
MDFEWLLDPAPDALAELAALAPESPFATPAYAAARAAAGYRVVRLGWRAEGRLAGGCLALARSGRLGGELEVPSAPAAPEGFWEGLVAECRRRRWWRVDVATFGSAAGTRIPQLPGERERRARLEHVVALGEFGPGSLSTNHRRSVKKARAAGVTFEVRREPAVAAAHVGLIDASMDRRAQRGEDVARGGEATRIAAFLEAGAGVCARAVRGEETLSSVLVLLARKGAYYHSAGSSPEGMSSGASPFLLTETAAWLRDEGCLSFNLGGATAEEAGLYRFKRGFGGTEIALEALAVDLSPGWARLLRRLRS